MIDVTTLTDGGQTAEAMADALFGFLDKAEHSLDIAIYDIRIREAIEQRCRDVLRGAVERGVKVRLVYELEAERRDPLPPPPTTDPSLLEAEPFPTHGVATTTGLMHHKYIVRDGRTVWTGSMNWTEDSWTRQENVVVVIESEQLARAYTLNLDELWTARDVESTGRVEPRPIHVGEAEVRPWFCPGHGEALAHRIAKHLGKAKKRIRIASPVLSSGPILATLVEIVNEGRCDIAGVIDDTQVDQVFFQWKTNGVSEWKIPLLNTVLTKGNFSGKITTPWTPDSIHDFMHAKVTVADDTSFIGSFNLSRSGERNAENVVEIHDAAIADQLATFIDGVRARYPKATPPDVRHAKVA